ncbi:MAG: 30S ribosome-binding factor RbfA [Thauera sp.]|jgi:ribosome-binding factor A|nr:30S ribosome-binding factor RbfA [Thauera sp.]
MPKEYSRSQRVVEQIHRELAEMIRLEVKDPRVGFITISGVEITPDYAHAKVFFTSMTGEAEVPEILQGLRRAGGFLRRELGRRMRIHTIPELHFHYDRSVEEGARLSRLIDDVVRDDAARQGNDAEAEREHGEGEDNSPADDDARSKG